nr:flavodoxin family protein [uncultured Mediterraneibacter sp.]
MGKRVLVLVGSPRRHGNTDCLADELIRGALESGHEIEKIYLKDKKVGCCLGCGACQRNNGSCVQKDDMQEIYEKWLAADTIVLASPVYFYTWSSLMKTVIDRTFAIEKNVKNTKFYLLSAGAAPTEDYMDVMFRSFRSYIGCFRAGGNEEGGHVFGTGADKPGDVAETEAMTNAYKMGTEL